ncbi:hypothetical protein RND71_035438 [Anisodus tanguticus]|uniref:Uncharacterized protein n=1 Tax=Anisodus tanguticus TaxID=243964 RepID=A0AAE1UVU6_9SOLA|nr:hypothetical protein RND71_035438 [Anisodus tanguticus]
MFGLYPGDHGSILGVWWKFGKDLMLLVSGVRTSDWLSAFACLPLWMLAHRCEF